MIVFLSLLTGHFKNLFYFTLIILIHELGHSLAGIVFKYKIEKIEIYPYGGCSKMLYDINTNFYKELLVLIMGPIFQILFMYIIYILKIDVPEFFYTYNLYILIFNLLPIYPLDGGRLLHLFLCKIISYYQSLRIIIYISYFISIGSFIYIILFNRNLVLVIIFILLLKQVFKEIKKVDYYFNKFLLERYLNNYIFNKIKKIKNIKKMKRYYYHYFLINNKVVDEKVTLKDYFEKG